MKSKREDATVEGVCALLVRSRLLAPEEVKALEERWRRESREPANLAPFTRWLVANRYATDYQVAMLLNGHADHFFLDHYKLLDRIARGRVAMVYKAVDHVGRVVAIKVLPPSKARDLQVLARFEREGRLALGLEHPNVVRTFSAGEDKGLRYLVMEYLDGETLERALSRRGRLPPAEAVAVVHQALLGLQYLHERGLVHRSLEPANLMLLHPAGDPRQPEAPGRLVVKVLDVSLSRSCLDDLAPDGAAQSRLTHEGVLLGNATYLAPEQARDAHAADVRADVYSLGCVLYHALAGRPPFEDPTPVGQMIRHGTETPPPLTEHNPEVAEGLDSVVQQMMAKDPAWRYQTPAEAAAALSPFLPHQERLALAAQTPPVLPSLPEAPWADLAGSASPDPELAPGPAPPAPATPAPELAWTEAAALPAPPADPENAPPAWPVGAADPAVGPMAIPEEAADFEPDVSPRRSRGARRRRERPGRRDCLLLLLGAAGLLLAQGLGWLLARLASALRAGDRPRDRE